MAVRVAAFKLQNCIPKFTESCFDGTKKEELFDRTFSYKAKVNSKL